jgi:hypothetical protein
MQGRADEWFSFSCSLLAPYGLLPGLYIVASGFASDDPAAPIW